MEHSSLKVSFDFDSTLDRVDVQIFASSLVDKGVEVWITTSRFSTKKGIEKGWPWIEKQNRDLHIVADSIGIKNIEFTDMVDKIEFLRGKNFLFHLDDDSEEIELIESSSDGCVGVQVETDNWRKICEELIDGALQV